MSEYLISRKFNTGVQRTDRVLECAEAFGLGLDDREFVVFDRLIIEVNTGDIVYITGQSGSGKSLLLRELVRQMGNEGTEILNIENIILTEEPLVDQVGATTREALELLSKAGLNDAYLFIRKPSELSDGQRYRMKLACMMSMAALNPTKKYVWVADEFGAVLDRVTAKVVAFSMQKAARSLGATLIVATTHTDLGDELGPNLTIHKRFREKVEVQVKLEDDDES